MTFETFTANWPALDRTVLMLSNIYDRNSVVEIELTAAFNSLEEIGWWETSIGNFLLMEKSFRSKTIRAITQFLKRSNVSNNSSILFSCGFEIVFSFFPFMSLAVNKSKDLRNFTLSFASHELVNSAPHMLLTPLTAWRFIGNVISKAYAKAYRGL